MGKGKFHYIEVFFDKENDVDDERIGQNSGKSSHLKATDKVPLQNITKEVTIVTLSGVPKYYTFRVKGIL
jgi:hypothetical protein